MTVNTVIKSFLGVKDCVIENYRLDQNDKGVYSLYIKARPYKRDRNRCPHCGMKCKGYDKTSETRTWRSLDCGGVLVYIEGPCSRVYCPEHGVVTAAVPWAFQNSGHTRDFDLQTSWLACKLNKSAVAEYMRVAWKTVGNCISRTREYLEPDPNQRLHGLRRIGIDETSYSKGHKYITTVVNHDTNEVVWVHENHGTAVINEFFSSLTKEERDAIEVVTGDGARWITSAVDEWCPKAIRCMDPFHVVQWATEKLDEVRRQAWREAAEEEKQLRAGKKPKRGRPASNDKEAEKLAKAHEKTKSIKNSRYALGKDPSHLTTSQVAKVEIIKNKNNRLFRAYQMKEELRLILKMDNVKEAEKELKRWLGWTARCRIPEFKELGEKVKRNKQYILNFIETGISNARVEGNNNLISLLIHRSFGFRNLENMFNLIMLVCSDLSIPLPNRPICTKSA